VSDIGGTEYLRPRDAFDGRIVLVEHDPAWFEQYARQRDLIRAVLGKRALQLEHVGSTSVRGLAAKPIIDIALVVADPAEEGDYVHVLEAAGFVLWLREPHWHEHRLFRRQSPRVNLHCFGPDCREVDRLLLFRDRLHESPEDLALYLATKRELATRQWNEVQDYADAKASVVEEIIARAQMDPAN
jgi:GrpB-like predicted nucleotidyltransferase (UPF0157 family)